MNEAVCSMRSQGNDVVRSTALCPPEDEGMKPLTYRLELQTMPALLSALTTIARLGGRITYLFAAKQQATVGVLVPPQVTHRVQVCLSQTIGVMAVTETSLEVRDGQRNEEAGPPEQDS